MAKLIVEIDLGDHVSKDEILHEQADPATHTGDSWFDPDGAITVDDAYLVRSAHDDSFFRFKLVEVRD